MLAGGAGGPAIVMHRPAESPLVQRIANHECPPKKDIGEAGIEPMTPAEFAIVEQWISAGAAPPADASDGGHATEQVSAADRQFWSFQPPIKPREGLS